MRIDTQLTDQDRDAVKEYAVKHGYTMKRAYTQLVRDALHDRFLMRLSTSTGNLGVKFAGYENHVLTNLSVERMLSRLEYYNGEWACVYAPRWYALENAGFDVEREPTFWIDGDDDPRPREEE